MFQWAEQANNYMTVTLPPLNAFGVVSTNMACVLACYLSLDPGELHAVIMAVEHFNSKACGIDMCVHMYMHVHASDLACKSCMVNPIPCRLYQYGTLVNSNIVCKATIFCLGKQAHVSKVLAHLLWCTGFRISLSLMIVTGDTFQHKC